MTRRRKAEEPTPDLTIYQVFLDAESFAWLHEMLKSKLKYQYVPAYLALVSKTLESFTDAERAVNGEQSPAPEPVVRKRTVPRKVAKTRKRR